MHKNNEFVAVINKKVVGRRGNDILVTVATDVHLFVSSAITKLRQEKRCQQKLNRKLAANIT